MTLKEFFEEAPRHYASMKEKQAVAKGSAAFYRLQRIGMLLDQVDTIEQRVDAGIAKGKTKEEKTPYALVGVAILPIETFLKEEFYAAAAMLTAERNTKLNEAEEQK